jgi:toxin-antitoxin system PIN domain toxin
VILFDVNVLLNAHRAEQPDHEVARSLLENVAGDVRPFALSELILSSFVRVATHRRALNPPTPLSGALDFCESLRTRPNARIVTPGPRHWKLFADLCRQVDAVGNLAADAYLAALAIESGCEWISFDRDFARFPGLNWRSPADRVGHLR